MRKLLAILAVAACGAVAVLAPTPDPYLRSSLAFHDFLHVPGFAAVTAILLAGFAPRASGAHARFSRLGLIFAASLAVGILVEFFQWAVRSDTVDAGDVLRDAVGTGAVLLTAASFWPEFAGRRRWLMRVAAMLAVLGFAVPTVSALADESRARRQFPVLADFSSPGQFERIEWSQVSSVTRSCKRPGTDCAAHVWLSPGLYPGFVLKFFPRDWRGYREFVLSCNELSDRPLSLTIRIDDMRHNENYSDRFNGTYTLNPGENQIRVPLADVERAPVGRKLDLGRVRTVVVFAYRLGSPREVLLQRLYLER